MAVWLGSRDEAIFWFIHEVGDGFTPTKYLHQLFWPEDGFEQYETSPLCIIRPRLNAKYKSRAAHARLQKLREDDYLVSVEKSGNVPGLMLLGWKGIAWIAAQKEIDCEPPKNDKKGISESEARKFQSRLSQHGIRWLREAPSVMTTFHDIKTIDVRLAFMRSVHTAAYSLEGRILESAFRKKPDAVTILVTKDGATNSEKRNIIPDDFVLIVDEERKARGEPHKLRALFEIDMTKHSHRAMAAKFGAYATYIGSPAYRERFGTATGRWFLITTQERRLRNLMQIVHNVVGDRAYLFCCSHFDLVEKQNVFTAPIWWQPGVGEGLTYGQLE